MEIPETSQQPCQYTNDLRWSSIITISDITSSYFLLFGRRDNKIQTDGVHQPTDTIAPRSAFHLVILEARSHAQECS